MSIRSKPLPSHYVPTRRMVAAMREIKASVRIPYTTKALAANNINPRTVTAMLRVKLIRLVTSSDGETACLMLTGTGQEMLRYIDNLPVPPRYSRLPEPATPVPEPATPVPEPVEEVLELPMDMPQHTTTCFVRAVVTLEVPVVVAVHAAHHGRTITTADIAAKAADVLQREDPTAFAVKSRIDGVMFDRTTVTTG